MALFPAIARLTALPGAAGASWTKRFKELLVIAVREGGRGLEGKKKMWPRCPGDGSGDRQRKPVGLIISTEGRGLSVIENEPICL